MTALKPTPDRRQGSSTGLPKLEGIHICGFHRVPGVPYRLKENGTSKNKWTSTAPGPKAFQLCQVSLQLSTSSTVEELLRSVRESVGCEKGRLLFRMRPLTDMAAAWLRAFAALQVHKYDINKV